MYPDFRPLVLLAVMLAPTTAFSLGTDTKQPISIEADSVDIDENAGTATYQGNVKLRQGSIKLDASTIVVERKGEDANRVLASGNPVRFSQQPDGDRTRVKGQAQQVIYETDSEELILKDQASLSQGKDVFRSDRIRYDRLNARVKAGAAAEGSGRVRMTLNPGRLQSK